MSELRHVCCSPPLRSFLCRCGRCGETAERGGWEGEETSADRFIGRHSTTHADEDDRGQKHDRAIRGRERERVDGEQWYTSRHCALRCVSTDSEGGSTLLCVSGRMLSPLPLLQLQLLTLRSSRPRPIPHPPLLLSHSHPAHHMRDH